MMTLVEIDAGQALVLGILVLYLGMMVNGRVRLLREHFIPAPVTGGLLFSILTAVLHEVADVELVFDMQIRDLLLLVFFSTVGLSAKVSALRGGGALLFKLVAVAAVFLVVQDVTGIGLAMLLGEEPGYGLMGGSVSLAGGHGTAIAWGVEAEAAGLEGAEQMGVVFATFGLVAGGVIGGPIAGMLIERNGLKGPEPGSDVSQPLDAAGGRAASSGGFRPALDAIFVLALCVEVGHIVNQYLFGRGVLLPGFLTSMLVGITITNTGDAFGRTVPEQELKRLGDLSLNLFLGMSLMSMQLWALGDSIRFVTIVLLLQVLVMTLFAIFIVFRVMGRDYDAAVISAGFAGLGLGATPVALANMSSVTNEYGPSPKAYLVVPLVGAFFIDLLNAATIKFFIGVISRWLT